MSILKPFKAFRPVKELVSKVASKPYDVLNSEEAREEVKGNEYSFLHVVKPEIDLELSVDHYDPAVYKKGRENLDKFIDMGILKQDEAECFYIYRQEWKGHTQTGIVACFSVDEYQKSKIKKHEFTRKVKEDDRVNNILAADANTGPVFLAFEAEEKLNSLLNGFCTEEPEYDFIDELNVRHMVYPVRNVSDVSEIVKAFEHVESLYIADGHHRAASASRVKDIKASENPNHTGNEEYNYFMAVLFPHNNLKIMDYNRVVADLNGMSEEVFFEMIAENFDVREATEKPFAPKSGHEFGMYINGKWYALKAKNESFDENDPVKSLDVSILQENLLMPVLGIKDPRTDSRIDFIGGIRGLGELEKLVDSGKWKLAFSMYPTSMDELLKVANSGNVMPPKSTWFEPKLRSGLFVHKLS